MTTILRITLAILGIVAIPFLAANADTLQGKWQTSFGTIEIHEEYTGTGKANRFYGTYANKGFVYGYNNGTTARGIFVYADQSTGELDQGRNFGTFIWTRRSNVERFDGKWTWGKTIPTGGDWSGTRISNDVTGFDPAEVRRWSAKYVIEAGADLNSWMPGVKDLSGAGYSLPTAPVETESAAVRTVETSESTSSAGSQVTRPPRRDKGAERLAEYMRDFDLGRFSNCDVSSRNPDWVTCENFQLPLARCVPGSLQYDSRWAGRYFCNAKDVSGSFMQSCGPMVISTRYRTNSDLRDSKGFHWGEYYMAACKGPRRRHASDQKVSVTNSTHVYWINNFSDPLGPHIAPDNDYHYWNAVSENWCPSKRFWNEAGILRCSN